MLQISHLTEPSLDRLLSMCSIYSDISDQLDTLQFSVEHLDWKEAGIAYRELLKHDSTLVALTSESLLGEVISLEQITTESGLLDAAKTFIDKIPALIIKIAVALITIITTAIVYFKKRASKGGLAKVDSNGPLTVKSYLAGDINGYMARYRATESMIVKLSSILNAHMQGDLSGISSRVKEAKDNLADLERNIKNPMQIFNRLADVGKKGLNLVKIKKDYQRNLETSLGSLHGLYPTHIHENIGVLVLNKRGGSISSDILNQITDTGRLDNALSALRNADIDTVLKNVLVSVTLKADHATSLTLDTHQEKELLGLIDKTNHVTSELIEKFDSGVGEIKLHIEEVKSIGGRLASLSIDSKYKSRVKGILDELNLTTKDITALIRDIQSLVLHLIIKY